MVNNWLLNLLSPEIVESMHVFNYKAAAAPLSTSLICIERKTEMEEIIDRRRLRCGAEFLEYSGSSVWCTIR